MKSKNIYVGLLFLTGALITTSLLIGQNSEPRNDVEIDINSTQTSINTTEDGTKYTVHPDELVGGCPSKDCIPSIDNPSFEDGNQASWMKENDRVIGVELNGETKAYPIKILQLHEIVNDRIGGEPIAVTYCPLCRSGVTYSRTVNNKTLEFGVSGKLLDANLVMYDRESESYWNQISGKAIVGPRTGQELELKFSSITDWEKWKEGHPETKVLSRNTGIYPPSRYDGELYSNFRDSENVGFGVDEVDDRLSSKNIVYGIKAGGVAKAYTEQALEEEKFIQESLGNKSIVIFESPKDGSINSFITEVDGEKLDFELEENGLRDSKGNLWNFNGEEVDGSRTLERLTPQGFYWFAWSKFNPETQIYNNQE